MKNFFITEDEAQIILDGAKRKSIVRELNLNNGTKIEIAKGVYIYDLDEIQRVYKMKNKKNRFDKE